MTVYILGNLVLFPPDAKPLAKKDQGVEIAARMFHHKSFGYLKLEEKTPFEDVYPIRNGDFPLPCLFQWGLDCQELTEVWKILRMFKQDNPTLE